MRLALLAVVVSSVALSGCMTTKLTPEQSHQLLSDFGAAGCGGSVDLVAGAASGQLGGEGHITLEMHGSCPVRTPPPLEIGQALPLVSETVPH